MDSLTKNPANGINAIAVTRLNKVWKFAMLPLFATLSHRFGNPPIDFMMVMTIINRMVPITLNAICTIPTRLASLEEPMEQTSAVVTQVPRLIPMINGYTRLKVIAPVTESA